MHCIFACKNSGYEPNTLHICQMPSTYCSWRKRSSWAEQPHSQIQIQGTLSRFLDPLISLKILKIMVSSLTSQIRDARIRVEVALELAVDSAPSSYLVLVRFMSQICVSYWHKSNWACFDLEIKHFLTGPNDLLKVYGDFHVMHSLSLLFSKKHDQKMPRRVATDIIFSGVSVTQAINFESGRR